MSPKETVDQLQKMCTETESEPDSCTTGTELVDLDSDSCSQGSQAAAGYCEACDAYIGPEEASVEAGGRRWHPVCLTCCVCGTVPDQRCFFTRNARVLCIEDFNKLYNTCRRCGLRFTSPWDLAIAAPTLPPHRYHAECFTCALCQRRMHKHEMFAAVHDDVFCPAHAHGLPPPPPPGPDHMGLDPADFLHQARPGRGRRRGSRRPGPRLPADLSEVRRKRHRIQFSAHQLRELQTAFSGNPNPDSKAIFDLASRLALGKQHVQVWFQNRRAKERRLKSESPQSES